MASVYFQYSIHLMFHERSFLAFQQHAGFQAFHVVPYVLGDVSPVYAFLMAEDE